MKKLEVIVKNEKFDELLELFKRCKVTGLMITNIKGYGNLKGYTQVYRGEKVSVDILPMVKVETVVKDEMCEPLIKMILDTISEGEVGDGKIFIYNVEDAVRIRTGERGIDAI